jgi:hypothetical protein
VPAPEGSPSAEELDRLWRLFSWMEDEASPGWWGGVVRLQRERVGAALRDFLAAGLAPGEPWDRLRADIHLLFVAIRHVGVYVRHFRELSDDPRLAAAEDEFLRLAGNAKDLRDFLEHLDEYAIGAGLMHLSGELDHRRRGVWLLMPEGGGRWDDEITVVLGEKLVPVKTAAHAAMALADALAEVHREEFDRTIRLLEEAYGRLPLSLLSDEPPAASRHPRPHPDT